MADENTILARLKMQGVGQFVADAGAAAKSVLTIGAANEKAAAATKLHWLEQKALGQMLYTVRRYAFWETAALNTAIAAGVKMGITFDESSQQATDSFTATLHSVSAARREVKLLTEDTHLTGIQLGDLAREAETMQSFGIPLKEVNTDILTLADYAERAKKGVSGFRSEVEVFDRIAQRGYLSSLDLRQLTSQGIPALQLLQKELHLTGAQVYALQHNKLQIPAQYALPALQQGLQLRADQLGTNLDQQLGITHSFLSQIFGTGEKGLFGFITGGLEKVNSRLAAAAQGQQTSGLHGLLVGLDPSGKLLQGWEVLAGDVRAFASAVHVAWTLAWPLRKTLDGLALGSFFLARQTSLVALALKVATAWYVISRSRLIALTLAEKGAAAAEYAYIAALYLYDIAAAIATADTVALGIAMEATPAGVLILAIAALAVGFYELGAHIGDVKTAFVATFHWVTANWPLLAEVLAAPFTFGLSLALTHLNFMQQKIEELWSWLRRNVFTITFVPHLASGIDWNRPLHIGGFKGPSWHDLISFPGLAAGGSATGAGWSVVGEHGPELRYLPVGAQIWPLHSPLATMTPALTQPLASLATSSTPVRPPMLAGGGTITRGGAAVVGDGGFPELARIPGPARAVPLRGDLLGELAKRLVLELNVEVGDMNVNGEKLAEITASVSEKRRFIR